jgi:hypothetical protein
MTAAPPSSLTRISGHQLGVSAPQGLMRRHQVPNLAIVLFLVRILGGRRI